jgi:hypothetical protein
MKQKPLERTLTFFRKNRIEDTYGFSFKRQKYIVVHTHGAIKEAPFPWDAPEFWDVFMRLQKPSPDSETLKLMGKYLRDFLHKTDWSRDEAAINQALENQQPIDLTIRSNAAEMYTLPWDLLLLEPSDRQLASVDECLIRYEWARDLPDPSSRSVPKGRILFAFSEAGGRVPFNEHLDVIQEACTKAGIEFNLQHDVLRNVTRKTLADALCDKSRPVTALHLLCHGTLKRKNVYGLMLHREKAEDGPDKIDALEFQGLLPSSTTPLRLVTLCACEGGDTGTPGHIVGSIAQALHRQGIPAVLASRYPLSVEGSNILSRELYTELLHGQGNLRKALSNARAQLRREPDCTDWASLQLYARAGNEAALYPFRDLPPSPSDTEAPRRDLVLICHEAYTKTGTALMPEDAPALFANRTIRKKVLIDQTLALAKPEQRTWKRLEAEVRRLLSPEGEFQQALQEPDAEFVYYGFPLVPLAVLAGYLARTRQVHLFENDRDTSRFAWRPESNGPHPPLNVEEREEGTGTAARLRFSVSATVQLDACRQVLADQDVGLDLHFTLGAPKRGIVQQQAQLQAYAQEIRARIDQHISTRPQLKSLHVFAAVPVSIAFNIGKALAASWLPPCYVYNYDLRDSPPYKWRLCLQDADAGKRSIKVFP